MKSKCYVFSGYKERNKACLVYLDYKLQKDSNGSPIWKLKCRKTAERTYLETSKQQRRYR